MEKKKKKVSYKREHGPEKLKTPALSIVHFTKHELYFVLPKWLKNPSFVSIES